MYMEKRVSEKTNLGAEVSFKDSAKKEVQETEEQQGSVGFASLAPEAMQTPQESGTDNKADEVTNILGGKTEPNVNNVVEETDFDGNDRRMHQTKDFSETSKAKRLFGLSRPQTATRKGNDPSNYEERFAEDAQYEETGSNARVWRVYQEESAIHDGNMVEEARDHVDVLLVFAGLFSAVVTTFIVQTSQNLQTNYSQVSASLLLELVLIQYSIANGTTPPSLSVASLNPSLIFTPSMTDVWVNALWFTSLFLSLTTALVGVLVKQWFHYYVALPSGTVRERCFVRQYRYTGIQKWKVPIIIGLLPVLMHLALAIFFAGLVLFLHPLQAQLSWFIGIGTVSVYIAYTVATILPMFDPLCPYHTPLCDFLYVLPSHLSSFLARSSYAVIDALQRTRISFLRRCGWQCDDYYPDYRAPKVIISLRSQEVESVKQMATRLSVEALHWLCTISSNPAVGSITVQAFGGLPLASTELIDEIFTDEGGLRVRVTSAAHKLLKDSLSEIADARQMPLPGMELRVDRLLRSQSVFPYYWPKTPTGIKVKYVDVLATQSHRHLSNPPLSDSAHGTLKPRVFFRYTILANLAFPPLVWKSLIESANKDGAFAPLANIHTFDQYPVSLCCAVLRAYGRRGNHPRQDFDSPAIVDFETAASQLSHSIITDSVISMISAEFDPFPEHSTSVRAAGAAVLFLLHQLALLPPDASPEEAHLTRVQDWPQELRGNSDVFDRVEGLIIRAAKGQGSRQSDKHLAFLVNAYEFAVKADPSRCSLEVVQWLCDTMLSRQWGNGQWYTLNTVCELVGLCLQSREPSVLEIFYQVRFLETLARRGDLVRFGFGSCWGGVVAQYIAVLSEAQGGSSSVDALTLKKHVDDLHRPENLLVACFLLKSGYRKDALLSLACLRSSDLVWEDCRRRLQELANGDKHYFGDADHADAGECKKHIHKTAVVLEQYFSRHASEEEQALMTGTQDNHHQSRLLRVTKPFSSLHRHHQKVEEEWPMGHV